MSELEWLRKCGGVRLERKFLGSGLSTAQASKRFRNARKTIPTGGRGFGTDARLRRANTYLNKRKKRNMADAPKYRKELVDSAVRRIMSKQGSESQWMSAVNALQHDRQYRVVELRKVLSEVSSGRIGASARRKADVIDGLRKSFYMRARSNQTAQIAATASPL